MPPEMWTLSQSGVVDFIYKREFRVTDFRRCIQNALRKPSSSARLNSNPYKYDLFISYSHRNKDWVQAWLLPELEGAGIKVCIDFRDFQPGVPMLHEMERAVIQSRKTLIVLTPDYLKSQPAAFETILVQATDPAAQYRRLIPLLLEPCELPLRIRQLAYIDFTASSEAALQLQRLIEAIKGDPEPFLC
ncbi:MAG: toll/interleukin-1 receptor domain-containing protein [bacterium]